MFRWRTMIQSVGHAPVLFALGVALLLAACGGNQQEAAPPAPPVEPVATPVDEGAAGSVHGRVTLEGTPPAPRNINRRSDPYCDRLGRATTQVFVVSEGGLENVFVYVKQGLGDRAFPVPADAVVLDQRGCTYLPRVFGIQAGQPLEILNSDETLHNIHALPSNNREFNRGQPPKGPKHTHVFTTPEVMVPFKCDVHNWMNAWLGVLSHPFFAVSSGGGAFDIQGLPPGTYTLEAWHEELGTATATVTIEPNEAEEASFVFKM